MRIGSREINLGYIVEGFNDEKAIWAVDPNAYIVVTKGTRFDKRVKIDIEEAMKFCEMVFIFTDPDGPGQQLANKIEAKYNLPRIQVDQTKATSYRHNFAVKKIGVEHCDSTYLKEVLLKGYCDEKYKYQSGYDLLHAKLDDKFYDGPNMHEDFKADLFKEYGVENHPKNEACFNLAWEHGHSAGYIEVLSYFDDFVVLLK